MKRRLPCHPPLLSALPCPFGRSLWVASLLVAAAVATSAEAAAPARAAPLHAEGFTWPRPIDVLPGRRIVEGDAHRRRRTCNLGEHTAATQPLPVEHDPMFRRPSDGAREAMAALLKRVDVDAPDPTAQTELDRLIAGPEGPALVREGIRVESLRWRTALVRAAWSLAANHPRLAGMFHNGARDADAAHAVAVATFLFRTDCDSPAMFGLPVLEHANAWARIQGIDEQVAHMARNANLGFADALGALYGREKLGSIKVRILRGLGTLQAGGQLSLATKALRDRDPAVRAEALVLVTQMTMNLVPETIEASRRDRAPVVRLGLVRALAARGTRDVMRILEELRQDRGVVSDPVDERDYVVGDVATTLLAQLRGARPPSHAR